MRRPERWAFLTDTHGDQQDVKAVNAALDFVKRWKPQTKIAGGDHFDFRALRRKASEEERRDGLAHDIAAGRDFLERYRPTHWLLGNHDQRYHDLLQSDDKRIADLAAPHWADILKSAGNAAVLPYDKWTGRVWIGDTLFMHGQHHGVNAARQAVTDFKTSIAFGHVHAFDVATVPSHNGPLYGYTSGCLCSTRMDYTRASPKTLRHEVGFLYGYKVRNRCIVYQARFIDGELFCPVG